MSLTSGTRLGPYEIVAPLGAGGMGEVYRAKDTRLDREVAIKVLPDHFSRDPERLARFEREAKLLATLNHPNIAAIHGFEKSGDVQFLVLELVEGETLSRRLMSGPVSVEDGLDVCKQIAEALEAAHEKGVIHRDLKPGNVMMRADGTVKVLDFGLAKAMAEESTGPADAASPTITADFTREGVVLGTAAYMSPEQARGRPLDKRTDIWSFGVILYECLTGQSLFRGETATDSMGAIMHREPDWSALPTETPPTVQLLLRRCLAKDRKKRLQDIADARIELEDAIADPTSSSLGLAGAALAADARHRRPHALQRGSTLALAVILTAIVVGAGFWHLRPAPPQAPLRKYEIAAGTFTSGMGNSPMISPDGAKVAYSYNERMWIRELAKLEPQEVSGSDGGKTPFWSPDSDYLAYKADDKLWKVAAGGGRPTLICELPVRGSIIGGSWGEGERIVFGAWRGPIYEVSARGGDPKVLLPLAEDEVDFHNVHLLPGGKGLLFSAHKKDPKTGGWLDGSSIELLSEATRRAILGGETELSIGRPVYSQTGHLLFHRQHTNMGIWAVPFSLTKMEVVGEPFIVVSGAYFHSVSAGGTLAYVPGGGAFTVPKSQLSWFDRTGKLVAPIGLPARHGAFPDLSRDGRRVAVTIGENQEERDVWVYDAIGETPRPARRVTFERDHLDAPVWSPKGNQIVFGKRSRSDRSMTLYSTDVNRRGEPKSLTAGMWPAFSPDGKYVVYTLRDPDRHFDQWYMPLEPDGKPIAFLQTPAWETGGRVSPDGRLIAYMAAEEDFDAMEVYIEPFPNGGGRQQVSFAGGFYPRWSKGGQKLHYIEGRYPEEDHLMEVEVLTEPSASLSEPRKLFSVKRLFPDARLPVGFDVSADGERFVIAQPVVADEDEQPKARGITIVQNWFAEFEDRR